MMKLHLLVVLLFVAIHAEETKYTDKYDNIDVDEILHSDRLLKNYFNCLMDRGRCTPVGSEIKKNLPDSLENECQKCSEKQKNIGKKILKYMIEQKREMFDEVEKKYDPNGVYRKRYEADLKKIGIKL
ncbi:unnamed protein product [Ceutorhynchus assimilis]|uniref:Chemosensory protein n=1 Tax=Ceutorhynchus assimilis TaxID=467358 RepID=A0A9N9ML36_9CUCU|nr:unnamed protein product [Ceutorhynchus assimilis]